MAVMLMGKEYSWWNSGPFLNASKEVKNKNQLIRAAKELLSQGMKYDPELSWDISSNEFCFVFTGKIPQMILVHPAKKEINIKLMGKLFSSLSGAVTQLLAPAAFKEQRFTIDIAESRAECTQADLLVREPHRFETENGVYEASYAPVYQQYVFPIVIEKLIFKGVIFSTYIFFESDDFILLLDQHAAHERVLYEKLKKEAGESTSRKSLLIPITFTPPRSHLEELTESLETFQEAGIVIEPFGEESFNITEIPAFVPEEKEEETLSILFEEFYEGSLKVTTRDIRDRFLKIAACRHAVKEGDKLTQDEAFRLLEDLGKTEVPYMCPHGRPTVIKQRKQYFEKLFRRR